MTINTYKITVQNEDEPFNEPETITSQAYSIKAMCSRVEKFFTSKQNLSVTIETGVDGLWITVATGRHDPKSGLKFHRLNDWHWIKL